MLRIIAIIVFSNKKRVGWAVYAGIISFFDTLGMCINYYGGTEESLLSWLLSGWLLLILSVALPKKDPPETVINNYIVTGSGSADSSGVAPANFVQNISESSSQYRKDALAATPKPELLEDNRTFAQKPSEAVYECPDEKIQGNLPIVLQKITVYKKAYGEMEANCTFLPIDSRSVTAMSVDFICYDSWHEKLQSLCAFQYIDLKTDRDLPFGSDIMVALPDNRSRLVDAVVRKIMFADGTMLQRTDESSYNLRYEPIENALPEPELLDEYKSKIGKRALYAPTKAGDYWICTCGAINSKQEAVCHSCAVLGSSQFQAVDKAFLTSSLMEKKQKEEEARLEKQIADAEAEKELAEKKKRRNKILGKAAAAVAVVAAVAGIVFGKVIPSAKYKQACSAMESGDYDSAYNLFSDILSYKDSAELAKNAGYQKASSLMDSGSYLEAAELFDTLGNVNGCDSLKTESYYLYGKELYKKGEFHAAYLILREKVNVDNDSFEDSVELANIAEYQYASDCFDAENYGEAARSFANISEYEDSGSRHQTAAYNFGLSLLTEQNYEEAAIVFEELGNYKDSVKKYKDAQYQKALALVSAEQFEAAVDLFGELGQYNDCLARKKEAMYAYTVSHKNRECTTTYEYLTELIKSNYKDSKKVYDELYAWTITGYVNTSATDTSTRLTSVSAYTKNVTFHYQIAGGPPGGTITLYHVIQWPDGSLSKSQGTWDNVTAGSTFTSHFEGYFWSNPAYARAGTLTSRIYDKATGKLIGTVEIKATK